MEGEKRRGKNIVQEKERGGLYPGGSNNVKEHLLCVDGKRKPIF